MKKVSNQQYDIKISLINSIGEEFELDMENIITLSITESVLSLTPKIDLVINNIGGFVDRTPITDKSMISVTVETPNKNQKNVYESEYLINAKFIISSFYTASDTYDNKYLTFNISGYLSLDNLLSPFYRQSYVGSSDQVLEQIATNIGYTFDRRVSGVEDNIWYQVGNNLQFMSHIADRSFVDGDGVFVYGTLDKKLVYTSLSLESTREVAKDAKYDKDRVENNVILDTAEDLKNMFYDGYNIMNNAEMYNNIVTYGGDYSYYDLTDYKYDNIRLNEKMTDMFNLNRQYIGNSTFSNSVGLLTDESFVDTIYKGKYQNSFYKHALYSNTILININNSTDVKLFDKVNLSLQSTLGKNEISLTYSGEYLVGGITTVITRDLPIAKKILLCRYGMNYPNNSQVRDII